MDWNKNLIDSVKNGDLNSVKQALQNGADTHTRGDVALKVSAHSYNLDIVKFLVENGALHKQDILQESQLVKELKELQNNYLTIACDEFFVWLE